MARPTGARNADYEAKRAEMMLAIRRHLSSPEGRLSSYRDLARACGVSVPTLNHYFGSREKMVQAILADALEKGQPYIERAAVPDGPFTQSIGKLIGEITLAFSTALSGLSATGLLEGLHHPTLGPVFLEATLEPLIDSLTKRLSAHMNAGDMRPTDARAAALILISPIIMVFLHQRDLGGAERWPLDIDAFVEVHVDAFVRAFAATGDAQG